MKTNIFLIVSAALTVSACLAPPAAIPEASTGVASFLMSETVGGMNGTRANFDAYVTRNALRSCPSGFTELSRVPTGVTAQQSFFRYVEYNITIQCK